MADEIRFLDSRPPRADAVRNREMLLETAARLFHDNGVENVTMSTVAQEAGVGKGTLYRHFNNKSELCHALLDQDQLDLQQRTLNYISVHRHSPIETLQWFLSEAAQFVDRHLDLLHVIDYGGTPSALEQNVHQWWRLTIRGLLTRSGVQGDIDYLTDTLFVMVDTNAIYFQRRIRGYSITRVVDGLAELVERLTQSPQT